MRNSDPWILQGLVLAALIGLATGCRPVPSVAPTSTEASELRFVGWEWDAGGSTVSVLNALEDEVREVRVGYQAEAFLSPSTLGVAEYSDLSYAHAQVRLLDTRSFAQLDLVEIPGRTPANVPGLPTIAALADPHRFAFIASSEDGYTQQFVVSAVGLASVPGQLALDACGPGFVGTADSGLAVIVVCPESRRVVVVREPFDAISSDLRLETNDVNAFATAAAFTRDGVVVCLTASVGPWTAATVFIDSHGVAGPVRSLSETLATAPSACSVSRNGTAAVGLWDGLSTGGYTHLVLQSPSSTEAVDLEVPVVGPVHLVGDELLGTSADGRSAVWFDLEGHIVKTVSGLHARSGLYATE